MRNLAGRLNNVGQIRDFDGGLDGGFRGICRIQDDSWQIEFFHFFPELWNGYNQFGIGIFDLFLELGDGVKGISGGGDGADGYNAEETDGVMDGVGSDDQNDVVFLYTQYG